MPSLVLLGVQDPADIWKESAPGKRRLSITPDVLSREEINVAQSLPLSSNKSFDEITNRLVSDTTFDNASCKGGRNDQRGRQIQRLQYRDDLPS